ncbi:hypothetical protein ACRRTK_020319 [Alexandromys fortis]
MNFLHFNFDYSYNARLRTRSLARGHRELAKRGELEWVRKALETEGDQGILLSCLFYPSTYKKMSVRILEGGEREEEDLRKAVVHSSDNCYKLQALLMSASRNTQPAVLKFAAAPGATPIASCFLPEIFTNQIQAAFRELQLLLVPDSRADP